MTIPLAVTAVIAFAVCLAPVRWDKKSLGPILPRLEPPGVRPGANILFVSPDNDWENGHYAQYGFDMITFPQGRFQWMVFKEGDRGGYSWPSNWMIDRTGRFYRIGADADATNQVPDDLELFLRSASVIVGSHEIKTQLLARWPALSDAKILLMTSRIGSFVESPRLRITTSQFLRIFVLAVIVVASLALAGTMTGDGKASGALRLLNYAFAFPAVLIVHTILVYLLGFVTVYAISAAVAIELLGAVSLLMFLHRKNSSNLSHSLGGRNPESRSRTKLPVLVFVAFVCMFIVFSTVRLDFDGDTFTQYLPVARYHYLAGWHDPEALMARYGVMTQATYPPGFPILISTLMWTAGVAKEMPVQFDYQTNLMVFLYRLVLTILHLSFLVAVGALFKAVEVDSGGYSWLLPVVAIPLVLPLFLGQPGAAEIYLVPIVGFSVLAFLAALLLNQSGFVQIGLLFGAFSLFIKKEGLLIFCLIVLTWYLALWLRPTRFSWRNMASQVATLAIALSPFLLWRLDLGRLTRDEYFFYETPSVTKLFSNFALLGRIGEKALKILLANNFWVVLFLILPLSFAYGLFSRRSMKHLLVPVGIVTYFVAMTCVFLFSKHPGGPLQHMDISYDRLAATPVLAAILYSAKVLVESRSTPTEKLDG
jgi:hypothetical protein